MKNEIPCYEIESIDLIYMLRRLKELEKPVPKGRPWWVRWSTIAMFKNSTKEVNHG